MLTEHTHEKMSNENYKRYQNKPLDLCSTCNYSEDCNNNRKNGLSVIYCEEFDDYVPVQNKTKKQYETCESKTEEKEVKIYLGLCCNCDFRETCGHKKPEGGIWHCEDYQ